MYIYIIQYAPDQQRKVLTIEKLVTQGGSTFKGARVFWCIPYARKQVFMIKYGLLNEVVITIQYNNKYTTLSKKFG